MNLFKTFVENNFGNLKERWANTNRKTEKSFLKNETNTSLNNSQNGRRHSNKIISIKNDQLHDINDKHDGYPDFLDGDERDLICIMLQNINIFRKKFDFNIFVENAKSRKIIDFKKNENVSQEELNKLNSVFVLNKKCKNENEQTLGFVDINRNAFSNVVNKNANNSIRDFEMNLNKNAITKSSNFPYLNTFDNKNSSIINSKKTEFNLLTHNEANSNLFSKAKESNNPNNTNTIKSFNLQTSINIDKNYILKNEKNEEKNNYYITTNENLKDRRIKTQENFFKASKKSLNNEAVGLTADSKNTYTNYLTNDLSENNFSKFESLKNLNNNNNNIRDKFKIPYEITVGNYLKTIANIKKDNYKNKDYLKSLANYKKDMQVSDNIIFLNNGSVLNTKPDEKDKSSKIHFSNFNAFSILNTNINNTIRLATSYDTRKPNLVLPNPEMNSNNANKNNVTNAKKSNYGAVKNNSSTNNIMSENSSLINLNNFNLLNNKTLNIKNKLNDINNDNNDNNKEKENQAEATNTSGMVGKDGNLKFYLSLIEKFLKLKENKAFENLDNVEYYKKIIKKKIEKENIVRKEYF